jgi:hypothetical protein
VKYILYLKIGKKNKNKNKTKWFGIVGNSIVADTLESADTRREMTCCSAALF